MPHHCQSDRHFKMYAAPVVHSNTLPPGLCVEGKMLPLSQPLCQPMLA